MTEKREDRKKKPDQSSAHQQQSKKFKDHRVLISLQLSLPVVRIFYRHRQLQVHKEVLLKDKLSFIVLIVEESTRESVGNLLVLVWFVDLMSTR